MPGEDQERFEDYLELERYIEGLQKGEGVHPPENLTPAQARIYRMAALFHAASSQAGIPRPQFVEALRDRLLAMEEHEPSLPEHNQQDGPSETAPVARSEMPGPGEQAMTAVHETGAVEEQRSHTRRNARFFSRRSLLTGGAVAAASLAAGAGLGAALTSAQHSTSNGSNPGVSYGTVYQSTPLVPGGPGGIPTTWHFVTTVAQLGSRAVQFTANAIIGYVILKDSDEPGEKEEIIALSAACTHMGCIVQWQESDRSFHCPCHGGLFDAYGRPSAKGRMRYLAALPRLNVKVENGNIYVEVPKIDS